MFRARQINPKAFGKRLQERREKLSISAAELAAELGVSAQIVSAWERGEVRRCGWVVELAHILHTTPEWIQWGEGKASTSVTDAADEMLQVLRIVARSVSLGSVLAQNVQQVIAKAEGRAR